MIEQGKRSLASVSSELEALQRRANRQRYRHRQTSQPLTIQWQRLNTAFRSPATAVSRLPSRLLLHLVVTLVLPVAVGLSQLQPGTLIAPPAPEAAPESSDLIVPLAPLTIDAAAELGDAPLNEDEIPIPLSLVSRSDALAPIVVQAIVVGDRVHLRNGPGTDYDVVQRISGDTVIQVIGRYGDWFKVRERPDQAPMWISGELLNIPEAAVYTLFEIQQHELPPLPPPKIGIVRESGLQLRDGPGTNYVPMASLQAGAKLDLIEIYQDWYHVGIPGGADGWVKGEFLGIEPGIVERLLVAETIPDPNPELVGWINDNKVNLRKGPDSRYAKVGMIDAGTKVDLIGKYKDWYRIRLADGTKAWVFSDLLDTTAHVVRRVPVSKDFPALPVAARGKPGASAGLRNIPASGDVASYAVQFVGARYRWGGASPSRGFDCSGLTSYVYAQYGVKLPHSAAGQFSTRYGASVGAMENLAPGDLVFFTNTGGRKGISHVALYIGGGRIVHAMTPRYGVQVSNIYSSYWVSHYYGGIRVRR